MALTVFAASRLRHFGSIAALVAMVSTAAPLPLRAQAPSRQQITVANIQVEINGSQVTIKYDLPAGGPDIYTVSLAVSQDDGQSFTMTPTAMTGDVGSVAPGGGKRIVWDAAKDTESLRLDRFRFQVTATVSPRSSPGAGTSSVPAGGPTQRPGVPAGTPPTAAKGSRSRSLSIPVLGLLGGGVALGAYALAVRKNDPFYDVCSQYYGANNCSAYKGVTTNTALASAGLALAGTGLFLLIRGKPASKSRIAIAPLPNGFFLMRQVTF